MSYIKAVKAEITNDPLGRGYSAMDDQQVADSLNALDITINKTAMAGSSIWEATDFTEFDVLTDTKKNLWLSFCGLESIDPFGPAQNLAISIFGGGSATITTLAALRVITISRAMQLKLGRKVKPGHVEMARTI